MSPDSGPDVVVVGAGVGGLMAGALLTRRGRRVHVLEAADRIGGYQCRFTRDGFEFEPHFHFLQDAGPGRPVRRLLDELGIELQWRSVDPVLRMVFPDRVVTMPADRSAYISALQSQFTDESAGIAGYFEATSRIHAAAADLPALAPVLARYGGDTVSRFVARFVRDPALSTILGGWAAYFGYGAGTISALAIAEFTEACFDGGVLQPVGGISALTSALVDVIEADGGSVRVSEPVERILVRAGVATGVVLEDGRTIDAPVVISNVNVLETLRDLAGAGAQRLEHLDRFRSPFSVFLGVRSAGIASVGAPVVVVFPGYDTDAQDRAQLDGRAEDAPVSLGIPTMQNPDLAPPGHDIVLLYTFLPAAHLRKLMADEAAADSFAQRLISVADKQIPGLRDNVVTMTTSLSAARPIYAAATGGALGWAPTPATLLGSARAAVVLRTGPGGALAAALTRLAPGIVARLGERALPGVTTPIRGLYSVGQWTRTGAGMNNVIRSADLVARAVTG